MECVLYFHHLFGNRLKKQSYFAYVYQSFSLFVEKLPKHPHFRQADQAQVKKVLAVSDSFCGNSLIG